MTENILEQLQLQMLTLKNPFVAQHQLECLENAEAAQKLKDKMSSEMEKNKGHVQMLQKRIDASPMDHVNVPKMELAQKAMVLKRVPALRIFKDAYRNQTSLMKVFLRLRIPYT